GYSIFPDAFSGSLFAIPTAMVIRYQHSYKGTVDVMYSTLVIYLITCVTFQLMIENYMIEIFRYIFFYKTAPSPAGVGVV
ncbi:hypothetical protein MMJ09_25425, partial [Bacillus vallismortis]|nr:hypothetical protein [Bacillus vallismortis]